MENKEDKKENIEWETVDEDSRSLYIFGKDVSEMPCFRNSFLYGIGGGMGTGIGKLKLVPST